MPGRTGRRRLPTKLKLLHGETRPSRINQDEPEPAEGVPPKPAHLKGDAAKEWARLAKLTTDMRVLTVADGPMLEATCLVYAELRETERLIAKEGAIYQTVAADGAVVDRERQYFSLGLGYRISNTLRADAGWMQEQFNDVYSPYTEVANAPIVDEEVIRNRFQIGFTYSLSRTL